MYGSLSVHSGPLEDTVSITEEKKKDATLLQSSLRYKPEGRGFDSRYCHWNFSLSLSFRSHYGPGVDSVSKRNEYQEYFLWVKTAGA
jgi:hypothetical protein